MRPIASVLALLMLGGSAPAQAPIVAVCEGHPTWLRVMNLGEHPLLFDLVDMTAASVDHSVLGATYTAQPLGYYKFAIPPEVASQPLSIRIHEIRCDGLRCAGEATDVVPASEAARSILLRDDGTALRKTVVDAQWNLLNQVSWTVSCNQLPNEPLLLHLTDGLLSRTVTVSGTSVDDPNSLLIVVGHPPLVEPTAGILDPYVQPPSVHPTPPPWTDVHTFSSPY